MIKQLINVFQKNCAVICEHDIDLLKLLTISHALEQSHFQAQEMKQSFMQLSDSINAIRPKHNPENSGGSHCAIPSNFTEDSHSSRYNPSKQEPTSHRPQSCYCCGNTGHRAKDVRCPASGKTCRSCSKVSHLAAVCRSHPKPASYTSPPQKQAFQVSEQVSVASYSDDDECIFRVQHSTNLPITNINVDGLSVPFVIDSGTTVNIVDIDTLLCSPDYALEHSIVYIWFKNPTEHCGDNNCKC